MAHYVDIETSAEALEEEKQLTLAVEAFVEKAAVSVWSEMVKDCKEGLQEVRALLERTFPMLVVYQERHDVLIEHVQALGLFFILIMLSFLCLAPWQRRRRKRLPRSLLQRSNSFAQQGRGGSTGSLGRATAKRFLPSLSDMDSPRSSMFQDASVGRQAPDPSSPAPMLVEETDEERFAHHYANMLDETPYAKLLLPPSCRRVETNRNSSSSVSKLPSQNTVVKQQQMRSTKKRKAARKKQHRMPVNNSPPQNQPQEARDNPALRLQIYWRHFLNLLRYLVSLDYAQAGWTLILWVAGILQHRRSSIRQQEKHNHEPEKNKILDNEDDESKNESSTANETVDSKHEKEDGNDNDDDTAATSGVDTAADEDVVSAGTSKKGGEAPSLLLAQADDDVFHTPTPASQKQIVKNQEIDDAPLLPQHLHGSPKENEESHKDIPSTECAKINNSSTKNRLSGMLRPRLKKQFSNRLGDSDDHHRETPLNSDSMTRIERQESVYADAESGDDNQQAVTRRAAESPFRSFRHFFEAAHNQESLQQISVDVPVPDKNGYILGDEFLPSSQQTPLLVFVNSRSGPQQGHLLITQLRRLLNPIQIWDLADGGPEKVLESFCVFTRLRILVCGGDGSVAWIISALEKLKLKRKWPPIAILPLGTGNDLARVMGWGGGYNNESLVGILEQISESYISLLDRWEMIIDDNGKKKHKDFFNYFGVGADAEAALQVHYLRESRPEWFFSRLVNKAWYGVFGAEDLIKNTSTALHKDIILYADGVEVALPNDSQGIIILNIDSYAGGIPIWTHGWRNPEHSDRQYVHPPQSRPRRAYSQQEFRNGYPLRRSNSMGDRSESRDDLLGMLTEEERYDSVTACDLPASCQDGILEVVSIRGLFHLGQIRVGLSNAQRLCQCRHIKIVTRKKVAFQIDGEPWRQDKCVLEIRRKPDPALMLHRSLDGDGAETEMSKLLEWAEDRQLIDGPVHRILMKEFSRRIESKTRRRRASGNGGVLQTLTRRAIGSSSGALTASHGMLHTSSQPNFVPGEPSYQPSQHQSTPQQQHQHLQHSNVQWPNGISF